MFMLLTKTDHQIENDMPWYVWCSGTKKLCVEQMRKWMELPGSMEAKVIRVKNAFSMNDGVTVEYMSNAIH